MKRYLALCMMVCVAACSSGGEYKVTSDSVRLHDSYESVKLVIDPQAKDSQEIIGDVRSTLAGQLLGSGRFHRISNDHEPADIVVTVTITNYQRVSVAERILVGALAGRNRVEANVTVTDGRSGAILRAFTASGKSAAHPLSSESGYTDALREFSKEFILGFAS